MTGWCSGPELLPDLPLLVVSQTSYLSAHGAPAHIQVITDSLLRQLSEPRRLSAESREAKAGFSMSYFPHPTGSSALGCIIAGSLCERQSEADKVRLTKVLP